MFRTVVEAKIMLREKRLHFIVCLRQHALRLSSRAVLNLVTDVCAFTRRNIALLIRAEFAVFRVLFDNRNRTFRDSLQRFFIIFEIFRVHTSDKKSTEFQCFVIFDAEYSAIVFTFYQDNSIEITKPRLSPSYKA